MNHLLWSTPNHFSQRMKQDHCTTALFLFLTLVILGGIFFSLCQLDSIKTLKAFWRTICTEFCGISCTASCTRYLICDPKTKHTSFTINRSSTTDRDYFVCPTKTLFRLDADNCLSAVSLKKSQKCETIFQGIWQ